MSKTHKIKSGDFITFLWALLPALIFTILVLSITLHLALKRTDGRYICPMDDPYIHLSVAKNVALDGSWGLENRVFSYCSSSIAFPLLISLAMKIAGIHETIPLVLNMITGVITLVIFLLIFRRIGLSWSMASIVLTALTMMIPLPVMIYICMEHVLQILAIVCLLFFSARYISNEPKALEFTNPWLLYALGFSAVMTRFESLFVVVIICLFLILTKYLEKAFLLLFFSTSPIFLMGIYSLSKGHHFLPTTLLIKSHLPGFSYCEIQLWLIETFIIFRNNPHLTICMILLLLFTLICNQHTGNARHLAVITNIIAVLTFMIHLLIARTGWYVRYEAYLIALFFLAGSLSFQYGLRDFFVTGTLGRRILLLTILLSPTVPLFHRTFDAIKVGPIAAENIYQQAYQVGHFLNTYYSGCNIAGHDIGTITYYADVGLLDLLGLSNVEYYDLKIWKRNKSNVIRELAQKHQTQIAICYDNWFDLPREWIKIGEWSLEHEAITSGEKVISFYAVQPRDIKKLQQSLLAYHLPDGCKMKLSNTPEIDTFNATSGKFLMGPVNSANQKEINTPHSVVLNYDFEMGLSEVTQAQFQSVMHVNPSFFQGSDLPVEYLTWYDAVVFCNRLSQRKGLKPCYYQDASYLEPFDGVAPVESGFVFWDRQADGYRLPTEAEWEYCCRAGSTGTFHFGDNINSDQANFNCRTDHIVKSGCEFRNRTLPVKSFPSNRWGGYDFHGNVSEWCWDWYGEYPVKIQTNPAGPAGGTDRVIRGGYWYGSDWECQSASRVGQDPSYKNNTVGFRVARGSVPFAIPIQLGEMSRIFQPKTGKLGQKYINDHCFIRDTQGVWHMFGITGTVPPDSFSETSFVHARAPHLVKGPWKEEPQPFKVERETGRETILWAPHIVYNEKDNLYYMFYSAGGHDATRYEIHLRTSCDLMEWTYHEGNPVIIDGYFARDPFVMRFGDAWIMYYTATSDPRGGNFIVAYQTSDDLIHWNHRGIAFKDPMSGTYASDTESPFVIKRSNKYFLIISVRGAYVASDVFCSDTPFEWHLTDWIATIPTHASEIITDWDGSEYISHCGWNQNGLYLASLSIDTNGTTNDK